MDWLALSGYFPVRQEGAAFQWIPFGSTQPQRVDLDGFYSDAAFVNEQGTQPIRFLILCDLDQDGGKERILRFSSEGGPYLLLFRKGEAFYGTERTRAFQDLQTDGVYAASNGAMDSEYARLRLRGGRFYEETLAHRQSGGSKESETFSIGGRPATEAAVLAWEKAALVGGGRWTPLSAE